MFLPRLLEVREKVLYLPFVHLDYGLLRVTPTTCGLGPLLSILQQTPVEERFASVSRAWRVPGPHLVFPHEGDSRVVPLESCSGCWNDPSTNSCLYKSQRS